MHDLAVCIHLNVLDVLQLATTPMTVRMSVLYNDIDRQLFGLLVQLLLRSSPR